MVKRVLVSIGLTESHARRFLRGIARYANLRGMWAFHHSHFDTTLKSHFPTVLSQYDGIIAHIATRSMAEHILAASIPTVGTYDENMIGMTLNNIIRFAWDEEGIAKMGAEYLMELGFQNYAYCSLSNAMWSQQRWERFSQRITGRGFEVRTFHSPRTHQMQHLVAWLKSLPKPTGLMLSTDFIAPTFFGACKIANVAIPNEIAVLGLGNDDLICDLSDPPLSSIDTNCEDAGYAAAELLDQLMQGKDIATKQVCISPVSVITRCSTDIIAVQDPDVAKALVFIRDNSKRLIQVGDVAEFVGMSRRTLERRFRKHLKQSVRQEISRVRLRQLLRVLVETNMTINEIAIAFGYSGPEHVSRFVSQEAHMSPHAYRRKFGHNNLFG